MSENIAAAIAAKNAVIEQQGEALDAILTALKGKAAGGSGTDISLGLTSAEVGQIIKVKAVDENGKPTEWETAEMAGGDKWELIFSDTKENIEVRYIEINKDNEGNPFELKKIRIHLALRALDQTFNYPYSNFNSNFYVFSNTGRPYPSTNSWYAGHFYYYDSVNNFGIYGSAANNAAMASLDAAINFSSSSIDSFRLNDITLSVQTIKSFKFGINVNNITDYKILIYGVRA